MSVEKINGSKAKTIIQAQTQQKTEEQPGEAVDKKLSNSAKYMIGATVLAGTIAIGIIGHKNNWWRKGVNAVKEEASNLHTPHTNKTPEATPNTQTLQSKPQTNPEIKPEINTAGESINPEAKTERLNLDYKRTELKDGYVLECDASGKTFIKKADYFGDGFQYTYEHKLENGNTLEVRKFTSSGKLSDGKELQGEAQTIFIKDKNGNKLYSSVFEEINNNSRTEIIYDYSNMIMYQTKSNGDVFKQKITSIEKNGNLSLDVNKEKITYEEFEKIRKDTLDAILPKGYDRLKAKHINHFPHKISDETKEFYRIGRFKRLNQSLGNDWHLTAVKSPADGRYEQSISVGDIWGLEPLYRKSRHTVNNELIETEVIKLPNGKKFMKKFNASKNEYIYEKNGKNISEQEFNEKKEMVLSQVGKKTSKRTFIQKYDVFYDNNGKFAGYFKYNEDGVQVERVIADFDDPEKLIIAQYDENGAIIKDKVKWISARDFDLSEVWEDQKKYGLL